MDEPTVNSPTEITVPVVEVPVPVPVTEIVEVPISVPVPVVSEELGEELTQWQRRVEQSVINLQQSTQQQMAGILEALQSTREINSSNQTCLLRIESLLSSPQPPNPAPAAPAAPAVEVVEVEPEEAEKQKEKKSEQSTRRKVRKV